MLTRSLLKTLAAKAHQLNPVVLIGANGLTPQVQNEIDIALNAHELIKIRVNAGTREERQNMIDQIVEQQQAVIVQQIGHILVIYRVNPDKNH